MSQLGPCKWKNYIHTSYMPSGTARNLKVTLYASMQIICFSDFQMFQQIARFKRSSKEGHVSLYQVNTKRHICDV